VTGAGTVSCDVGIGGSGEGIVVVGSVLLVFCGAAFNNLVGDALGGSDGDGLDRSMGGGVFLCLRLCGGVSLDRRVEGESASA